MQALTNEDGHLIGFSIERGASLLLNGDLNGMTFSVVVDDPDVLEALGRYDPPEHGLETLLRVGACAMLAGGTSYDIHAVRQEIDRAVDQARTALDGLSTHVSDTMAEEGPFARALDAARADLNRTLEDLVARQADPDQPGSLVAKIQAATKRFDEVVDTTRSQIAEELRKSSERQADQLSTTMRQMRDLDPNSAIGGAFSRIETAVRDLNTAITAGQHAAAERSRSAMKGADYEDLVSAETASIAAANGDLAERTGSQPGGVVLNKKPSLRGDVTCSVFGGTAVVTLEAMDRSRQVLTVKAVKEELDEAMRNRAAQAAIAVVSSAENGLMCGQPLQILGPCMWAVLLDKDDPQPLALRVAYTLARHVACTVATQEHSALELADLKQGVEEINRCLSLLGEVRMQLSNIRNCEGKASLSLGRYEREVGALVGRLLGALQVGGISPEYVAAVA